MSLRASGTNSDASRSHGRRRDRAKRSRFRKLVIRIGRRRRHELRLQLIRTNRVEPTRGVAIPGHGNAERVVEEKSGDLALIRLYGARNLTPAGLIGATAPNGTVTLIGVADPQA